MTNIITIAVSSAGPDIDSAVEPVIGRADFFFILNVLSHESRTLKNPHRDLREGCGVMVATTLADEGVDAVLAGNCGPKAARAFRETGVKVLYPYTGTVRQAIDQFLTMQKRAQDADPKSNLTS